MDIIRDNFQFKTEFNLSNHLSRIERNTLLFGSRTLNNLFLPETSNIRVAMSYLILTLGSTAKTAVLIPGSLLSLFAFSLMFCSPAAISATLHTSGYQTLSPANADGAPHLLWGCISTCLMLAGAKKTNELLDLAGKGLPHPMITAAKGSAYLITTALVTQVLTAAHIVPASDISVIPSIIAPLMLPSFAILVLLGTQYWLNLIDQFQQTLLTI